MNKGIMVISGGMLQIPALIRARELNFTIYLTDGDEQCLAKPYADFFYKINTKDIEGNAKLATELANEKKIIAVYTQGADVAYTVAYSAKKAGLPGIDPQSALNCNDKITMREILSKNGIKDVVFEKAKTVEELEVAVRKVGFPCYVKPADNCGSRGITKIVDEKNLQEVFDRAIGACYHRKEIIVESEIRGKEYSVDTIIYKGKLYPAGISDRVFMEKEKYAVQIGSRTPSLLPGNIQDEMYKVMERAAKALGVDKGAFKGDLVVDQNNDVRIIEVTARTSGGYDSQLRKPLSFGIDLMKATIDIACGYDLDPVDLVPRWIKWSSTISALPEPGVITEIKGVEEVKNMEGVRQVTMLAKVGDMVEPYDNCAKRRNFVISSANTYEGLLALEKNILDTLLIKTKKYTKKTTGINGFGRFGLHLLKYWLDRKAVADFEIIFINDDTLSIEDAFNIIISDPYVVFNKYKVSISGNNLLFVGADGTKSTIEYTKSQKFDIPWIGKPHVFLECSGKNTIAKDCEPYLKGNTRFVMISATSWDAKTFVYGFNHQTHTKEDKIISYGSCTVNAYVPLADYINKKYGVIESDANFIHNIALHKLRDFNTLNRKFCTLEKSGPNLLGFLNSNNFTVNYTVIPYGGVSMLDMRFKLKRNISKDDFINDLCWACSEGELKFIYDLEESDRGPEVHNCTTYSAIFIKENIRLINGNLYLHGYFDNENSVNRYFDLANYISINKEF